MAMSFPWVEKPQPLESVYLLAKNFPTFLMQLRI